MNKNNKPIQLSENDLHFLVESAVKTYLKENGMDESLWGGLSSLGQKFGNGAKRGIGNAENKMNSMYNSAKNAVGNMATKASNAMGNAYNNAATKVGNAYNQGKNVYMAGSANADAQKAIKNAASALNALLQADNKLVQIGQPSVIGNGRQKQQIMQLSKSLGSIGGRFQANKSAWSR